ncbi:MAG TPA: AI-2E family transporter [Acidimicrobiales bacterium]|nr:AI-2E family transporter [Acidimicrobiales bacterium]
MAGPGASERLRLTPRSAVLAVAMFGLTLGLLALFAASRRVLGWVVAAAALAGILHPAVSRLARRLPRGLAVAVVAVAAVGAVAVVAWRTVDEVADQTDRLRRAAPAAARRVEAGEGRVAELARQARLAERTERFVDEVPERLRGGRPAQALRSAATRGVAYLATFVLTVFLLLHGPGLAAAAARQVHDPPRRARLEAVAGAAFARGFSYLRGSIAMALAAGAFAYLVAEAAGVPAPAPLALWVALWDVVPYLGALVGAAPIVLLGGIGDPGRGLVLALAFVAYEVAETVLAQRRLERRTVRLGPFLTAAGAFAGLELYGLGGALLAIAVLSVAAAAVDELAPDDAAGAGTPDAAAPVAGS